MSTAQNTGRVAVITGASSGIGEATARALAADGHRVALLARRADRIQALADELGNGAIAIEADVTDRSSIVAAAERVQQELGGADILVNNAGVMLTAPFTSDQREEHRRMVETNLLGAPSAWPSTKSSCAPPFRRCRHGRDRSCFGTRRSSATTRAPGRSRPRRPGQGRRWDGPARAVSARFVVALTDRRASSSHRWQRLRGHARLA